MCGILPISAIEYNKQLYDFECKLIKLPEKITKQSSSKLQQFHQSTK